MPRNLWPPEVDGCRDKGYARYRALDDLGAQVLSALALHIDVTESWFADKTDFGNSILRPIHYPPITADNDTNERAGAHEDINLITLVAGARAAGPEVEAEQGAWGPITRDEDRIGDNISDQLQRLTDHVYASTTHRVVTPTGEDRKRARLNFRNAR